MDTTLETIQLLQRYAGIIERVSLFRFVPLPGSRVYSNAEENRLIIPKNDWNNCHIHHNPYHWWGNEKDFAVVEDSYVLLDNFILDVWGCSM